MSAKPETVFIDSVHRHLPAGEPYRMKNHNEYVGGIADVWYDGVKADLWVEYKFITLPKRDITVIDLVGGKNPWLSPLQQKWLCDRVLNGRSVGVIVGCKEGGVWFPGDSWTAPLTTLEFCNRLNSRPELAEIIWRLTMKGG
jgi:hypothetical protein